jgi:hypothetical protein
MLAAPDQRPCSSGYWTSVFKLGKRPWSQQADCRSLALVHLRCTQ